MVSNDLDFGKLPYLMIRVREYNILEKIWKSQNGKKEKSKVSDDIDAFAIINIIRYLAFLFFTILGFPDFFQNIIFPNPDHQVRQFAKIKIIRYHVSLFYYFEISAIISGHT